MHNRKRHRPIHGIDARSFNRGHKVEIEGKERLCVYVIQSPGHGVGMGQSPPSTIAIFSDGLILYACGWELSGGLRPWTPTVQEDAFEHESLGD